MENEEEIIIKELGIRARKIINNIEKAKDNEGEINNEWERSFKWSFRYNKSYG